MLGECICNFDPRDTLRGLKLRAAPNRYVVSTKAQNAKPLTIGILRQAAFYNKTRSYRKRSRFGVYRHVLKTHDLFLGVEYQILIEPAIHMRA